jgi:hypothetical protein
MEVTANRSYHIAFVTYGFWGWNASKPCEPLLQNQGLDASTRLVDSLLVIVTAASNASLNSSTEVKRLGSRRFELRLKLITIAKKHLEVLPELEEIFAQLRVFGFFAHAVLLVCFRTSFRMLSKLRE